MEIFSKIKELFSKASVESMKQVENRLNQLERKFSFGFISIIGYSGRLKGLPLIYNLEKKEEVKKISARAVESIYSMLGIIDRQNVEFFEIRYTENILYFRKITKDVGIIALVEYGKDIDKIKDWVGDNLSSIVQLFQS